MEYKGYEMVIGLEVHCELKTATKIFCSCPTTFGAEPNTQCCPVCMGMPGTLPVLNRSVVEYAVTAGLATGCEIAPYSKQDRKNYFYPDLPKAYQISQYDLPLCAHGHIDIECADGGTKRIGITRIHIEEDAGKLIHDELGTLIDCNRCGVPLIEIVSEPEISSAEEAKAYVRKLRAIILYTGISDCKMNEGSMRVDVNLSVRPVGEKTLGTRAEMKNLNSINFIGRTIEYEFRRQVDAILAGEEIVQETRRYDPESGKTTSMRRKENANDYRYFPDPDLPPLELSEELISSLRAKIPTLPDERKVEYTERCSLPSYDAELLTQSRSTAEYFEAAAAQCAYPRILSNLLIGEILSNMQEDAEFPVSAGDLAALADLAGREEINNNTAKRVLKIMVAEKLPPAVIVARDGLEQINDRDKITALGAAALAAAPKALSDYKSGKKSALKSVVGAVMASSGGRANPRIVDEVITHLAESKEI